MKKPLPLIIAIAIAISLVWQIRRKLAENHNAHCRSASYREFCLPELRDGLVCIKKGEKLIIYFSPLCDACEKQGNYFSRGHFLFSGTMIYFISDGPIDDVMQYARTTKIAGKRYCKILTDPRSRFKRYYGIRNYPTILFYDKDDRLVFREAGEITISKLIDKINENKTH